MRWRDLFADLEGQALAWERADLEAEIADRSRAEQASVTLAHRLSAAVGAPLCLRVRGVGDVGGRVEAVGKDWLLLEEDGGVGERLILARAVLGVLDLDRRAHTDEARGPVSSRLGVLSPLRAIVRDRAAVRCAVQDGSDVVGTPERVGADHLDLLLHEVGQDARASRARRRMTVPFETLAMLTRLPSGWG